MAKKKQPVDFNELARRQLKMLFAEQGLNYIEAIEILNKHGIKETYLSLTGKINRGSFSFPWFLSVIDAFNKEVQLKDK